MPHEGERVLLQYFSGRCTLLSLQAAAEFESSRHIIARFPSGKYVPRGVAHGHIICTTGRTLTIYLFVCTSYRKNLPGKIMNSHFTRTELLGCTQ